MDMRSFNSALHSALSVSFEEKTELAWMSYVAACQDHKAMEKFVRRWNLSIDPERSKVAEDQERFLKAMTKGRSR